MTNLLLNYTISFFRISPHFGSPSYFLPGFGAVPI